MPESLPPLRPDQVAYLEGATSILVGSCSSARMPEGVRGVGIRVLAGGGRVSVLVPTAMAARTLANLASNPHLAVTTASFPTYSTIQLKGELVAVRDGDEIDRALASSFQARFATEFAWAGDAITRTARIAVWPCTAIELAIETVYTEAPAPLAKDAT